MKTHTIKTPTAELMIVELPYGFQCSECDENYYISSIEDDTPLKSFSKIDYDLLGKPDEIREEDANELVESKPIFGEEYRGMYHVYPKESKLFTASSVISLLSLLESEIYWDVNPLGDSKSYNAYKHNSEWFGNEIRTFDRSRTLIFVKQ